MLRRDVVEPDARRCDTGGNYWKPVLPDSLEGVALLGQVVAVHPGASSARTLVEEIEQPSARPPNLPMPAHTNVAAPIRLNQSCRVACPFKKADNQFRQPLGINPNRVKPQSLTKSLHLRFKLKVDTLIYWSTWDGGAIPATKRVPCQNESTQVNCTWLMLSAHFVEITSCSHVAMVCE